MNTLILTLLIILLILAGVITFYLRQVSKYLLLLDKRNNSLYQNDVLLAENQDNLKAELNELKGYLA